MWSRERVLAEWRSLFECLTDEYPTSNTPLSPVTSLHQECNDDQIVHSLVTLSFHFISNPRTLIPSLCVCVCVCLRVCVISG